MCSFLFRGRIIQCTKHINMSFTKNRDIRNRRCQLIPSSRSSPRSPTRRAGRFFSRRSIRLGGKQAESITINALGDWIDDCLPSVGRRYPARPVRLFRTFYPISGHFRPVSGHCPSVSAIARSSAPFRSACRYPVPLSRAVCLKKIAPPIG